jgi:hypothetical protein
MLADILKRIEEAGSLRSYAAGLFISESFVQDVIDGKRLPSDTMIADLGVDKYKVYCKSIGKTNG